METILVVDDDPGLLLVLQHALSANGYVVSTLADSAKVMETIETIKPRIVILDARMGECNGCAISASIKNTAAFKHITVVLYSSVPADEVVLKDCKADLFLQKPLSTNYLIQKIASLHH